MTITANNPRIGWHSVLTVDNITVTSEDPAAPLINIVNPATYLQWRALEEQADLEQIILTTLEEETTIDYIGVYGHNFGSQAIELHVEYFDGSEWQPCLEPFIPLDDDRVIFRTFDCVWSDQFRVRMVPDSGVTEPPEMAVLHLGRALTMPRRIYVGHTPMPFGREPRVTSGLSENGQFLGRVLESTGFETSVNFENLSPQWMRQHFDPFIKHCITRPYFWSWRPSTYEDEAAYAWFTQIPRPTNQRENGMMSVGWSMGGVIYRPFVIAPDAGDSGES